MRCGRALLLCGMWVASGVLLQGSAHAGKCSAKWRELLRAERDVVKRHKLLGQALKTCPDSADYNRKYGYSCERLRRYDEALKYYNKAVALDPQNAQAHFGVGDVQMVKGNIAAAVSAYEQGLRIKPKSKRVKRKLELARIKLKADVGGDVSAGQMVQVLTEKAPKGTAETSAAGPTLRLRLTFMVASARLTKRTAERLKTIAAALTSKELQGRKFQIAGHTDSVGGDDYNLRLSKLRAEAVKAHLVKAHGINAAALVVAYYGSKRPIAPNDTKANRARNRRVELRRLE